MHDMLTDVNSACYEEFTAGQQERINSFWSEYRG
jgi:hypothetical protein